MTVTTVGLVLGLLAAPPSVVDGDTIKDAEHGRMRLEAIDAPELGGRADCLTEAILAVRARDRLAALLPAARIEFTGRRDGFNRPLVRLVLPDGRTASDILISEGLAVPWDGHRAEWCLR